jgi:hypothetical protein
LYNTPGSTTVPGKRGLHEVRTRVTCHLPVNDQREEKAFFKVLTYLKGLKDQRIGVTGWTTSALRPAAFQGWWWSEERAEWIPDSIVLCIVNYQLGLNDSALSAQVNALKQAIRKWYRYHRSPQEEVWVVAHQVIRQD